MKWHVRQYVSIPFGELETIAQKPAMVEGGLAGEPAYDAAKAIAEHMGWSLSAVIEDAIAARYKQFSIPKPAETKTR